MQLQSQTFPVLTSHKFFDNFGDDFPARMIKTSDQHLLIGGHTIPKDSSKSACGNIWIIKVDTAGTLLWEREINMSGCEELRDLIETEDGGIIFSGTTTSLIPYPEQGDERYWSNLLLGKIDSIGRIEWLQSYGGSNQDQGFRISPGPYRDYLICGLTHSNNGTITYNHGLADAWALKIDTQGEIRDSKTFGGTGNDWAVAVARCSNGDILLAGYSDSKDAFRQSISPFGNGLLIRLGSHGKVRWMKPFVCPQGGQFSAVEEVENGRIMVAGHCTSTDRVQRFWWLLLSAEGIVIQESMINGPQPGILSSACSVSGGYLLAGYSDEPSGRPSRYTKGGEDFWLVKLDSQGRVLWKDTYGGPGDERCLDALEFSPGIFYAIGSKKNQFTRDEEQDLDFWLIRVEERPTDAIEGSIWVRMENNKIFSRQPTRFSARVNHGDRFFWDFGDGTTSTDPYPLKSYDIPGLYDVTLTIYVNEHCSKTVSLPRALEVW